MLIMAGVLCFLLGAVHSILGERMIFQPLRKEATYSLLKKYRGILWATWHLVTIFGACLGLYLLELAGMELPGDFPLFIVATMLLGALLVGIGTKGRHPGWIILLLIAILILIAN
ncbi:MAG: hypothetical protein R8G66_24770 [Cytophagales bacterium]|nr:hypothetical protein [Cytophagales bacterium]